MVEIEDLKPGDRLEVTVGPRRMKVEVRSVSKDGKTVFTNIGPVPAANLAHAKRVS